MNFSDQELLPFLAQDVHSHFDILVETYQQKLFIFIFCKAHQYHDVEDILQETFANAYHSLASSSAEKILGMKIRPWLFKIAHNCAVNYLTRKKEHPSKVLSIDNYLEEIEFLGSVASPEEEVEKKETYYEICACIRQLPDAQRLPVILHYILGFKHPEVADILEQPFNTVKSNGRRGLKKLQKMLQQGNQIREEVG